MWELDHKEVWALKNWSFWTVVLKNTLENPLDCKEIKPVNPKGNQSWIFTGGIDTKAEAPVLWPPDAKNWLIGKDPDAGKDWRQEEKGMTEDEMVGWHHWLNGHEFEQAPGDGEGQGSLACCSPWGHQESDITEWRATVSSGIECCYKGVWDQLDSYPPPLKVMFLFLFFPPECLNNFLFLAVPRSLGDLSFLIRDQTQALGSEGVVSTDPPGPPGNYFNNFFSFKSDVQNFK